MTTPALAVTADGYMTIGGIGGVPCSVYTNRVAEARQRWGLNSPDSWNALNSYVQYAFGFMMAYNALQDGVYDIAAGVRDNNMPTTVLTIIDSYCQDHPTDVFDRAMWDLVEKLTPTATTKP